jgi:ankyrin repeat protein
MHDLAHLIEAIKRSDLERVVAILNSDDRLANENDESGATPLHYAAFIGHRQIVEALLKRGANINRTDSRFGTTPAGWAIEYLRERGGYLAIELDDLAYAIQIGDSRWVARFLERFPSLRQANDRNETPFQRLAWESGNAEISKLFGMENERDPKTDL